MAVTLLDLTHMRKAAVQITAVRRVLSNKDGYRDCGSTAFFVPGKRAHSLLDAPIFRPAAHNHIDRRLLIGSFILSVV